MRPTRKIIFVLAAVLGLWTLAAAAWVFYSQRNSAWSGNELGTCGTNTTIGSDGCAITALAMALNDSGANVDPGKLNTWLTSNSGYASGCLVIWQVVANYPGSGLSWVGDSSLTSPGDLKSAIDSNKITIVTSNRFAEHFGVIRGYNGDGSSWSDFYYWDPWDTSAQNRYVGDGWVQPGNSSRVYQLTNPSSSVGQGAPYPQQFVDCYNRNGGQPVLGLPFDNGGGGVNAHAYGGAWIQDFNGGSGGQGLIVDSPGTQSSNTAYYIPGPFYNCFNNRDGGYSALGWPINDVYNWGNHLVVQRQDYSGNSDHAPVVLVFNSSTNQAYLIHGYIWSFYQSIGGPDSPIQRPTSDESIINASQSKIRQQFEGGAIYYWGHGTFDVEGGYYTRYEADGDTGGVLGWPTSVEQSAPSSSVSGKNATVQTFENGSITFVTSGGIPGFSDLYGPIFTAYSTAGTSAGPQGFPTSGIQAATSPQGTAGQFATFEAGEICTSSAYGTFTVPPLIQGRYGQPNQQYGYPKGNATTSGNTTSQVFEGGTITSGSQGSGILKISGSATSSGHSTQIQVTINNAGSGIASQVSIGLIQLGPMNATGLPWNIGDLAPGASVSQTFTFQTSLASGQPSLLSANALMGASRLRLRSKVTGP